MLSDTLPQRSGGLTNVLDVAPRTKDQVTTVACVAVQVVDNGEKVCTRRVRKGEREFGKTTGQTASAPTAEEATIPSGSLVGDVQNTGNSEPEGGTGNTLTSPDPKHVSTSVGEKCSGGRTSGPS